MKREVWCAVRDSVAPQALEVMGPAREEETSGFAVNVPYLHSINTQNYRVARKRFVLFLPQGIVG